ncbi:nectin-1-like isoform X5 [Mustela erminea]|uniref:nectin-1-like isoform X5 n=1 Tax=Mustela erminea TaxID=36723 RepID=UPI001386891F|nr:nectin-1-like isoform X5 [Mustela erminea]
MPLHSQGALRPSWLSSMHLRRLTRTSACFPLRASARQRGQFQGSHGKLLNLQTNNYSCKEVMDFFGELQIGVDEMGYWRSWKPGNASSPHRIKYKNNETAVFGENVTIFCNLTTPADIVQITWQKIQGSLPQNIGTYSSVYGETILPPYRDRLHCEVIEPNSSFITIREVTFEDEACYKCLFNVFPHGSHGGQICLTIIALSGLKTELQSNLDSEDFLRFIYSAMGKPVPQISLFPSQVLINPPEEYLAQNPNGTVTITKMCNISLETVRSLGLQYLTVRMDHPLRNEEKIVPLSVKQECTSHSPYTWLRIVGLPILLLCFLSIVIYLVWRKKKSENALETTPQLSQPDGESLINQDFPVYRAKNSGTC